MNTQLLQQASMLDIDEQIELVDLPLIMSCLDCAFRMELADLLF
jgi:hypothetical protein